MSSLDAATEALLEEGARTKKARSVEKSVALKIFHNVMYFAGFTPIIIAFVVPDKKIATTAAAGAAFVSSCLNGINYKLGGTKRWPKIIDISLLSSCGLLAILFWTLPKDVVEDLVPFLNVFIFGGFVVVIGIAWACFNVRIAEQYVADMVSDEAELSHPAIERGTRMCTIMFLVGFTVIAGIFAADAALNVTGTLRIILWSVSVSILGIMIFLISGRLDKFMIKKYYEKLPTDKYPEELAAWEAANPDHPWAK